jgi:hypothetical protein
MRQKVLISAFLQVRTGGLRMSWFHLYAFQCIGHILSKHFLDSILLLLFYLLKLSFFLIKEKAYKKKFFFLVVLGFELRASNL